MIDGNDSTNGSTDLLAAASQNSQALWSFKAKSQDIFASNKNE